MESKDYYHEDAWARAERRDGYADGRDGIEPRMANKHYLRGHREGRARQTRLADRLLIESSPPMDFISGPDWSLDEEKFADFIRDVGQRAVAVYVGRRASISDWWARGE